MAHIKKFTHDIATHIVNRQKKYTNHLASSIHDVRYWADEIIIFNYPREYERIKKNMLAVKRNTITLVGVIINMPSDLDLSDSQRIKLQVQLVLFLMDRYGEDYVVSAIANSTSLKYYFMPIVYSPNIGKKAEEIEEYIYEHKKANDSEVAKALGISRNTVKRWRNNDGYYDSKHRFSAAKILTRQEFKTFHKDLRDFLNDNILVKQYIGENVGEFFYTDRTKTQGENRTSKHLIEQREVKLNQVKSQIKPKVEKEVKVNDEFEF